MDGNLCKNCIKVFLLLMYVKYVFLKSGLMSVFIDVKIVGVVIVFVRIVFK